MCGLERHAYRFILTWNGQLSQFRPGFGRGRTNLDRKNAAMRIFNRFSYSETSSLPHTRKAFVKGIWVIFGTRRASAWLNRSFSATALLFLAATLSNAQMVGPSLAPSSAGWGDPYQMAAPGSQGAGSSAMLPSMDGFLGIGQTAATQLGDAGDPYATMPGGVQLNGPVVSQSGPTPVIGGPMFQGGPVYNSMQNWPPMLPRFRNRIDSRLYLRAEYLLWDVSGMDTPPLVTTSPGGTPESSAAVIGQPGTSVLFGGNEINDGSTNGFLISGGFWFSTQRNVAIESEYFSLADQNEGYNGSSDGTVILGRPFFNIVDGSEDAQLISYPGQVGGDVHVATESNLRSLLINGRMPLCPSHGACCQQCGMRDRTDWIIGYRNIRLRDALSVSQNLRSASTNLPVNLATTDQFKTTNEFNGLQLGMIHRMLLQRAWLESSLRVAIGNNNQTLQVGGNTSVEQQGVVENFSGGLLAQRTNSGTRSRDEFTMVPEVGLRLGVRLTDRFHANIGYSILYLPNVIRASEQIDRDINPGLIPEEDNPLTGALRPRVLWTQTDYLAHGLHFGGELNF